LLLSQQGLELKSVLEEGRICEHGPRVALAGNVTSRFYSLLQTGLVVSAVEREQGPLEARVETGLRIVLLGNSSPQARKMSGFHRQLGARTIRSASSLVKAF